MVTAGIVWGVGIARLGAPADLPTLGLAAASGMAYYGLAFWLFIGGLRGLPASVAGSMYPLIPVFGLAAAYLVGDRLSGSQWIGAAIVVLGVAAAAAYHLDSDHALSSGREGADNAPPPKTQPGSS